MKTILVPTDFSAGAEAALHFAVMIARQQKASLLLAHVYTPDLPLGPVPYEVIARESTVKQERARARIKELCRRVDAEGDIDFDYALVEGAAVDKIVKVAKESGAALIIMGNRGEGGLPDFLFGTTATGVIEQAPCPVIAIPENTVVESAMQRITYATDFLRTDIGAIRTIVELARPVNAVVTVLHVAKEGANTGAELGKLDVFCREVESSIGYGRLACELLSGDDVEAELKEYVYKRKTDALVLCTKQRGLLSRLLAPGITGRIARTSPVPVIAFHFKKDAGIKIFA